MEEQQEIKEETKSTGRQPDFKGDGVAVWVDKNEGKPTKLNIKVVGHGYINAWENVPRIKKDDV